MKTDIFSISALSLSKWSAMQGQEARRLGMWVDMTTGTGWPFGGPMITDEYCDAKVWYQDGNISQQFSGRMVKRAAPGNEGKAINPFSSTAMSLYLKHFDAPFGGKDVIMPRAMYHDSYEFMGNWCNELPAEFQKRRGYDLMEHLDELFGEKGDADTIARIKSDYRQTLSDLHLDYLRTWVKWSESKGCTTRNQAHGSPSNLLDLYAASEYRKQRPLALHLLTFREFAGKRTMSVKTCRNR